jgi:hypothetical protein
VHVIVFPEDIPVEIQIRTRPQNQWAQATESLGDAWGRGLRYADGPDEPDSLAGSPFAPSLTRAQVVEKWTHMSDLIADTEQLEIEVGEVRRLSDSGLPVDAGVLNDLQRRLDENVRSASDLVAELGYGHLWSQQ